MTIRFVFISLLMLGWTQLICQGLLTVTLTARHQRNEYHFLVTPGHCDKVSRKLKLTNIEADDSFSLRLWTGSMMGYGLIMATNRNSRWETHLYSYLSDSSIIERKFIPKIPIGDFVRELEKFDFDHFISQYQIKDFRDNVDDGVSYTLEIIKGKSYKVFQYHSPEEFSDMNNKIFYELIELIKKYFHW